MRRAPVTATLEAFGVALTAQGSIARAALLDHLAQTRVPARAVERLETRMGG